MDDNRVKLLSAGDNISQLDSGNWTFNEGVADIFNKHIGNSVPCYEESQRYVVELSDWYLGGEQSIVYDLGCASGKTIVGLMERHRKKDLTIYGLDSSKPMLDSAKEALQELSPIPENIKVHLLQEDALNHNYRPQINLVYCLYTLQFVEPCRRQKLIQTIYDNLVQRGALIMIEKVIEENAVLADIYKEIHWNHKSQFYGGDEILSKALSLRGRLVPLTIEENFNLLKQVGFQATSIFFKMGNFLGIVAVK